MVLTKKRIGEFLIFFAVFFIVDNLFADVILLKNGSQIVTQGTWEENGRIKYFKDGTIRDGIPKEEVAGIRRGDPPSPKIIQPAPFSMETDRDLESQLSEKSPPKNDIEAAGNATVTIRAALGTGSGFFITENGYILTNRHVIEGDPKLLRQQDRRVKTANEQLKRFRNSLDDRKREIESLEKQVASNPRNDIPHNRRVIRDMKKDYDQGVANYRKQKKAIGKMQSELRQLKTKLLVQRTVEVVLADGTELRATIVKKSDRIDLALLYLENTKTPCLRPDPIGRLSQGQPLFAIGNPLNFSHSVSAGVFSGFQRGMIMTSAPINHGNSGGPLVTESGSVVGINTSKMVGRGVEGIGFALPIHTALNEFREALAPHLKNNGSNG